MTVFMELVGRPPNERLRVDFNPSRVLDSANYGPLPSAVIAKAYDAVIAAFDRDQQGKESRANRPRAHRDRLASLGATRPFATSDGLSSLAVAKGFVALPPIGRTVTDSSVTYADLTREQVRERDCAASRGTKNGW